MSADCLFCRIVERTLPATVVAEDETLVSFQDINPQAPTHILIVPKTHIANVADLTDATAPAIMGRLTLMANRLAKQFGFADDGYRLVVNCGPHGGQTVSHLHLHLLGGRRMTWPPG